MKEKNKKRWKAYKQKKKQRREDERKAKEEMEERNAELIRKGNKRTLVRVKGPTDIQIQT